MRISRWTPLAFSISVIHWSLAAGAPLHAQVDNEEAGVMALAPTALAVTHWIQGGHTTRAFTIASEEITRRGIRSVDDVIRTNPQVLSSFHTTNYMNFGRENIDRNLGALADGCFTAKARGLGSANTVVVLNGKRIADAAGSL